MGTESQLCVMKRVLEMDSGDGCITANLPSAPLKMAKMVNFVMCVLP